MKHAFSKLAKSTQQALSILTARHSSSYSRQASRATISTLKGGIYVLFPLTALAVVILLATLNSESSPNMLETLDTAAPSRTVALIQ